VRRAKLAYQPFRSAEVNLRPVRSPVEEGGHDDTGVRDAVHPFGPVQACHTLQYETIVSPSFEFHDGLEVISEATDSKAEMGG